jgi:hypothetical protein
LNAAALISVVQNRRYGRFFHIGTGLGETCIAAVANRTVCLALINPGIC